MAINIGQKHQRSDPQSPFIQLSVLSTGFKWTCRQHVGCARWLHVPPSSAAPGFHCMQCPLQYMSTPCRIQGTSWSNQNRHYMQCGPGVPGAGAAWQSESNPANRLGPYHLSGLWDHRILTSLMFYPSLRGKGKWMKKRGEGMGKRGMTISSFSWKIPYLKESWKWDSKSTKLQDPSWILQQNHNMKYKDTLQNNWIWTQSLFFKYACSAGQEKEKHGM